MMAGVESATIEVAGAQRVCVLRIAPPQALAACVLAHGAGAGMAHPFMTAVAERLAARRVATLRYQFPYMERGSKRPDSPAIAHATVRAAVTDAARRWPELPLFAGGKSFGARMTSQAQSAAPMSGVRGLLFLGFPLHPAGRPAEDRASHLARVAVPMLFIQGTRDELATPELIERTVCALRPLATLRWIDDADHAFHVRARSGRDDAAALDEMLDACTTWMFSRER